MARVMASQRREDFIQAAVRVIAEYGVDGATTRRIAAEANAPLASLHYCFASKEELFFAIYEHQVKTLEETVWHARKGAGLGRTAANLLRQLMGYYDADEAYARTSAELYFWVLRQDGDLGAKTYDAHLELMVNCLKVGMREDDDVNLVEPLARMTAAITDGLSFQWFGFHDRDRLVIDIDLAAESLERLADAHRSPAS